jgi:hypothetical protein
MLPNFTVVICGAFLTVVMLAVTGSGLITPETRTRIGEMPEVGRPMMQQMITEPTGQAQFMALELSRRTEELARLRDLVTPAPVAEPVAAVRSEEPAPAIAQEVPQATAQVPSRTAVEVPTRIPAIAGDPITPPIALESPAADAPLAPAAAPAPLAATSAAPAAPLPGPRTLLPPPEGSHAAAPQLAVDPHAPAGVDAAETASPENGEAASAATVVALAEPGEVSPTIHLPARLSARLPLRVQPGPSVATEKVAVTTKAGVPKTLALAKKPGPAHHASHRPQRRHPHRAYAVGGGTSFPFGPTSGTEFR